MTIQMDYIECQKLLCKEPNGLMFKPQSGAIVTTMPFRIPRTTDCQNLIATLPNVIFWKPCHLFACLVLRK